MLYAFSDEVREIYGMLEEVFEDMLRPGMTERDLMVQFDVDPDECDNIHDFVMSYSYDEAVRELRLRGVI